MLGLIIETANLMVGIPPEYVAEVLDLLNLAEGTHWVVYLLTHLYTSITYALTQNKRELVDTSPEFRNIILSLNWYLSLFGEGLSKAHKHSAPSYTKKDKKDRLLISINVLKFVTVIINYCAALHFVTTKSATGDPYPAVQCV